MAMPKLQAGYAIEGSWMQRLNPDNSLPSKTRLTGFSGTVDLSGVLTSHAGSITIKIDDDTAVTKTYTSTAASDSAVTVAEAIADLTTCAFTGFTWSADSITGRLKGVSTTGTIIQITGELAAALDFGQGLAYGGNGLELISIFDDRMQSSTNAKTKKDKEDVDQEGALGTIRRMTIPAKILGMAPTITMRDKDYELLELVQGGTYDRTNNTYEPPLSNATGAPSFWMQTFTPLYADGTNKIDDNKYMQTILLRSCMGSEGDVPNEAKSWATYAFDITATDYKDETGVLHAPWQEAVITKEAFLAMNVENV